MNGTVDVYCMPIDRWDGPRTDRRQRSPFSVTAQRAMKELERELVALGATDAQLGIDLRRDQIRMDGWPKSGANPPPPVVLTFESKVGPLRFQCDRFDDWRGNLRAIGLTLQRLRLVDEGGVARSGEQYQGWNALPPNATATIAMGAGLTDDEAGRLLCSWASVEPLSLDQVRIQLDSLYRLAAKNSHPDHGGNEDLFKLITAARDQLRTVPT